ncbi:MAG: hypothetical protein FWG82_06165 [Oscillospiraceae bacterium]|nr:hypothetical protein [Oscillospiraceae bacterium]
MNNPIAFLNGGNYMSKSQTATQSKSNENKQICMDVDGCVIKLNISTDKNEVAKIETVKRMILNGLAKV